jgi:hypothetical protein
MNLQLFLLESIFIGIFSAIIYCTLKLFYVLFVFPNWLILFILGILKHFFGYYLGIQNIFCSINCKKSKSIVPIFIDYLLEGVYFVIIGEIISNYFNFSAIISVFLSGVFINILAELLGIHKYYCLHNCI